MQKIILSCLLGIILKLPYLVYTPSFLGDWEIRPDAEHESRYRFVIHDGELSPEAAERLWRDYAEPLVAKGS